MSASLSIQGPDQVRKNATRFAGFLFPLFIIVSVIHYSIIDLHLADPDHIPEIVDYILSHELLFRAGIVIDLILFCSGILLALLLYIILKPIDKNFSLLAFVWLAGSFLMAVVIELTSFVFLALVDGAGSANTLGNEELYALLGLCLNLRFEGYNVTAVFFSLGFLIFSYLFYKSRYIPRMLAGFGVFSFSFLFLFTFIRILLPDANPLFFSIFSLLSLLFELILGLWFLVKGVKLE